MISAAFQPFVMGKLAELTKQQKESKMTTTKEQLARVEKELAELKLKIEAEEKSVEPMFPAVNHGDAYYLLSSYFSVLRDYNLRDYNSEHSVDRYRCEASSAFTDEAQAKACADYLKDRFWFIRKAIEFADGYEFGSKGNNYRVVFDAESIMWDWLSNSTYNTNDIYMTKVNANKFIEWLNIHKPEGF